MIDMPKLMKGLEKSMTSSRTKVIVRGAIAISAFCKRKDTENTQVNAFREATGPGPVHSNLTSYAFTLHFEGKANN